MKVYSYSDKIMFKGGWVAPPTERQCGKNFVTEERVKEIAECGINLMHIDCSREEFENARKFVEYGVKYGVCYILSLGNTLSEDFSAEAIKEELEYYNGFDNVIGYNLCDEPGMKSFPALASTAKKLRPYIGNKVIYINHMPMYATTSQLQGGWWSPYESAASTGDYYDFLDKFFETVDNDIVSYDFYPFRHEKGGTDFRYFDQLCVAKRISEKYDKPFWNFTQVTSWNRDVVRNMTYSELAWLNNTSLACGVTCLQYFCYWTPADGVENFLSAMISRDGHKTRHYYFAKDLNQKVDAISPYLLSATHKGVIPYGDTLAAYPTEYALTSFGNIKSYMSDGMIIGCFEREGKNMYYLVNTSVLETRVLELYFNKEISAEVIIGTEKTEFTGSEIIRPIAPGEGMLIVEK